MQLGYLVLDPSNTALEILVDFMLPDERDRPAFAAEPCHVPVVASLIAGSLVAPARGRFLGPLIELPAMPKSTSMKMARCILVKTMSVFPASRAALTLKRCPRLCSSFRMTNSTFVSRPRMRDMVSAAVQVSCCQPWLEDDAGVEYALRSEAATWSKISLTCRSTSAGAIDSNDRKDETRRNLFCASRMSCRRVRSEYRAGAVKNPSAIAAGSPSMPASEGRSIN